MKKFTSISLLILYLLGSVGFAVKAHYCGGDLASVSLFEQSGCCCEENGSSKKDDCCKDEVKSYKIADAQVKTEPTQGLFTYNEVPDPLFDFYLLFNQTYTAYCQAISTPLPDPPDVHNIIPAYKRHHCFLFYC